MSLSPNNSITAYAEFPLGTKPSPGAIPDLPEVTHRIVDEGFSRMKDQEGFLYPGAREALSAGAETLNAAGVVVVRNLFRYPEAKLMCDILPIVRMLVDLSRVAASGWHKDGGDGGGIGVNNKYIANGVRIEDGYAVEDSHIDPLCSFGAIFIWFTGDGPRCYELAREYNPAEKYDVEDRSVQPMNVTRCYLYQGDLFMMSTASTEKRGCPNWPQGPYSVAHRVANTGYTRRQTRHIVTTWRP